MGSCAKNDCFCDNGLAPSLCKEKYHQIDLSNPNVTQSICQSCDAGFTLTSENSCCQEGTCDSCALDLVHITEDKLCYPSLTDDEVTFLLTTLDYTTKENLNDCTDISKCVQVISSDPFNENYNLKGYLYQNTISASTFNQDFFEKIILSKYLGRMEFILQHLTVETETSEIGDYLFYRLTLLKKLLQMKQILN